MRKSPGENVLVATTPLPTCGDILRTWNPSWSKPQLIKNFAFCVSLYPLVLDCPLSRLAFSISWLRESDIVTSLKLEVICLHSWLYNDIDIQHQPKPVHLSCFVPMLPLRSVNGRYAIAYKCLFGSFGDDQQCNILYTMKWSNERPF